MAGDVNAWNEVVIFVFALREMMNLVLRRAMCRYRLHSMICGNSEQWLPYSAVGNLLANCRPTVGQQSADNIFWDLFFTIT